MFYLAGLGFLHLDKYLDIYDSNWKLLHYAINHSRLLRLVREKILFSLTKCASLQNLFSSVGPMGPVS
jgi:hypothetical protein